MEERASEMEGELVQKLAQFVDLHPPPTRWKYAGLSQPAGRELDDATLIGNLRCQWRLRALACDDSVHQDILLDEQDAVPVDKDVHVRMGISFFVPDFPDWKERDEKYIRRIDETLGLKRVADHLAQISKSDVRHLPSVFFAEPFTLRHMSKWKHADLAKIRRYANRIHILP